MAASDVFVDGSVVEALMFELVAQDDPVYAGTLAAFSRLQTPFGGYQRLEPKLSLTGGSGADLYDASEWIMLDLRIGQAARRMGDTSSADTRLDWVTHSAALNDNLIPELFDCNNGGYAGAVPIVGYGAGAWLMTALKSTARRRRVRTARSRTAMAWSPTPVRLSPTRGIHRNLARTMPVRRLSPMAERRKCQTAMRAQAKPT